MLTELFSTFFFPTIACTSKGTTLNHEHLTCTPRCWKPEPEPRPGTRAPAHKSPGPELTAGQRQVGVPSLGRWASPPLIPGGPVQAPRWLQARRTRSCSPNIPAQRGRARSPLSRRIPRLKSGFPAELRQPGVHSEARSGGPGGGRSLPRGPGAPPGGALGDGSSRRRPPRTSRPRQAPRARPSRDRPPAGSAAAPHPAPDRATPGLGVARASAGSPRGWDPECPLWEPHKSSRR